jgi:hypothetical protein
VRGARLALGGAEDRVVSRVGPERPSLGKALPNELGPDEDEAARPLDPDVAEEPPEPVRVRDVPLEQDDPTVDERRVPLGCLEPERLDGGAGLDGLGCVDADVPDADGIAPESDDDRVTVDDAFDGRRDGRSGGPGPAERRLAPVDDGRGGRGGRSRGSPANPVRPDDDEGGEQRDEGDRRGEGPDRSRSTGAGPAGFRPPRGRDRSGPPRCRPSRPASRMCAPADPDERGGRAGQGRHEPIVPAGSRTGLGRPPPVPFSWDPQDRPAIIA